MSYDYQKERPGVFTEEGQVMFLKIRDNMTLQCKQAGAVSFYPATKGVTGRDWMMKACIDRLIELGEFECVYAEGPGQYWIYRCK